MSKDEGGGDAAESQTTSPDAPSKDPNAEIYENRGSKKIIRVVTVVAYLFSVSFVGILLSAYYLFLWEPPNPKLIVRERLLADPQMQFLVAAAPSVEDVAVRASEPVFENELNQITYKTLMNRIAEDMDDDPIVEKRRRMNATLLNLRHSLAEAQRARHLNLSREVAISNVSDDSFVKEVLNSTKLVVRAENSILRDKNTSEEKIESDNTDPPVELVDSTLDVESTSSTVTIPGSEANQSHLEFVTDVNRRAAFIVHRERENQSYERKLDAAKASDDIANGSDHRAYKDNNSSKVVREFPEVDLLDDNKELIKQNETDERQLINSDRENPNNSSDVRTIAMSEDHVKDRTNHHVSIIYAVVNSFRRNNFDSSQKIAHDKVSIGSPPSRDAGFTDDPGFHQPPDESTVVKQRPYVTADSKETQIERMTLRPAMMDDKQMEETDLSTTQRKILTETTDIEETSVELTSVSTATGGELRDYLNFTSTANDNDESIT